MKGSEHIMSEQDPTTIRKIDWKSVFPFIHLFRGFRLAIDPSKLVLALAALLMLYVGGRLLDAIWPSHSRAMNNEIREFETGRFADFHQARKNAAQARYDELKQALRSVDKPVDGDADDVAYVLKLERDKRITEARDSYAKLPDDQKTDAAAKTRDDSIASTYRQYGMGLKRLESLRGEGLFIHFIGYQIDQIDAAASAAVALDFTGPNGVGISLYRFFIVAPQWAITQHYIYFTVYFAIYVLLLAICGGAISRIAAVQVARDEKISVRQALRFSTGKVLSFIFAPLIPIIIIMVIALVLGVLSLFMSLGVVGGIWSIVVGALFILALLAGLVMTLTALGLLGGGHLMYPTIAVEGSDSFDAVSRSFSYLYARPWQMIFYSLVALVYGAITYLFVRFFLYLLLSLTHAGVGMFMWADAADGTSLMDSMWPTPESMMNLSFDPNFTALGFMHTIGAWLIALWVYLAIAMLGAYAISLYFSSSTIIYYLMRKEVDATAMDEVYLEPNDDDFVEQAPEVAPIPATPASSEAPTEPTKPAEPAPESKPDNNP
jgi:hypothetical protein